MNTRTQRYKNLNDEINNQLKYKKRKMKAKKVKKFFGYVFIICILVLLYSWTIEPYLFKVNEIKIVSEDIDKSYHGLKIVHISDIHYGRTVNEKRLKQIVIEINKLKPDIVLFTGDLIDDDANISLVNANTIAKTLNNIKSTYGKYAVIGNHDFFNEYFKNIIYDSSWTLLNNNYDIIYNNNNDQILIYGVDDVIYGNPNIDLLNDPTIKDINYKILLVHEPDFIDNFIYDYDIDLIVSGHSHNKQVNIPFVKAFWLPPEAQNYYSSYYNINNTDIYISNGIGTSGVNFRLFSIPSINFYRITKP